MRSLSDVNLRSAAARRIRMAISQTLAPGQGRRIDGRLTDRISHRRLLLDEAVEIGPSALGSVGSGVAFNSSMLIIPSGSAWKSPSWSASVSEHSAMWLRVEGILTPWPESTLW